VAVRDGGPGNGMAVFPWYGGGINPMVQAGVFPGRVFCRMIVQKFTGNFSGAVWSDWV